MKLDRWNKINAAGKGSVYSIFNPGEETVKVILIPSVLKSKAGEDLLPELDLVPTTFNLVDLENEYDGDPSKPHYTVFRDQLAEVEDNYDFILFDCPPPYFAGLAMWYFLRQRNLCPVQSGCIEFDRLYVAGREAQ